MDVIAEVTGCRETVIAGSPDWLSRVELALDLGQNVAVGVDHPWARRLFGSTRGAALAAKPAKRALEARKLGISARYAVWPSAETPALIYRSPITGWWMQRAGIIGGGGRSSRRQWLARSWLAAPIVALIRPSSVWVVHR